MRKFIYVMFSFLVFFIASVGVYADREDVDSIVYVSEGQTEIAGICSRANTEVGSSILVYTSDDGLLSFSNKKYSKLDMTEKRDFMEVALLTTKESGLGPQVKNKVYNFIADQDSTTSAAVKYLRSDASADFAGAVAWYKPFSSVFGVVLGLLSLFIFMFLGLSILIDISYMVIPGVKLLLESGREGKPKFVSPEAYTSLKESTESQGYRNYMSLYFSRRVPTILIMSIALGYLISGKIYDIIVFIIDAFTL